MIRDTTAEKASLRFFLAYPLRGEAAAWHRRLTAWVAARCGIADVAQRVPPHLTIVPPFAAPSEAAAREWGREAAGHLLPLVGCLGRFGVFAAAGRAGGGVLYAAVRGAHLKKASAAVFHAQEYVARRAAPAWRPRPWTPHATVAHGTRVHSADALRRLLLEEMPEARRTFPLDIAEVVLYRKEAPGAPWRAACCFRLG